MEQEIGWLEMLNWVDIGALIVLAFFLLLGLLRGLAWQVIELVKVVGGILLANHFAETVGGWLQGGRLQAPYSTYLAWILIFVVFHIAMTIGFHLLRQLIKKLKLASHDRLLGAALGLVNGWLLVTVITIALFVYPPTASVKGDIVRSHAGWLAARTGLVIQSFLPAEMAAELGRVLDPAQLRLLEELGRPPPATEPAPAPPAGESYPAPPDPEQPKER